MVEEKSAGTKMSDDELQELVAATDTGGRNPSGPIKKLLAGVALFWSLFQLWIASPIPFALGFGVFNDTEARSIHLALALFLAFDARAVDSNIGSAMETPAKAAATPVATMTNSVVATNRKSVTRWRS